MNQHKLCFVHIAMRIVGSGGAPPDIQYDPAVSGLCLGDEILIVPHANGKYAVYCDDCLRFGIGGKINLTGGEIKN